MDGCVFGIGIVSGDNNAMTQFFRGIAEQLMKFLQQPLKVLAACALSVFCSLVFDGRFLHWWSLTHDQAELESRTEEMRQRLDQIEARMAYVQKPEFIEREARERFELVEEGDLIFVFSDEAVETEM